MHRISAIVPAAGLSRRMDGPNKLLLPWGEGTVVGAVVRTLTRCGLDVIVVTGRDADLVREAVAPAPTVYNERFAEGIGTSLSAGVRAATAGGYLVALGDMPGIWEGLVQELLQRYDPGGIVAPHDSHRFGHPVLFGGACRQELLGLSGDNGAKKLFGEFHVTAVPVRRLAADIDHPADLPTVT